MKRLFFVALLVLFSQTAFSQFKIMTWYEQWLERPLGESGYGAPPWAINWNGIDAVVHFGNQNVTSSTAPYFTFRVTGNSDSVYFFRGSGNLNYNFVDSLTKYVHAAGGIVVLELMDIEGSALSTIAADSTMTDILCTSAAQFCELHDYDGLDVNWENNRPNAAVGSQFIRILRRKLNQYLTTPRFISRPWLSLTCPLNFYSFDASFPAALVKDSVDMICAQQGGAQWVWDPAGGNNILWYGAAVKLGADVNSPRSLWIASLSEDANAIPANQKPTGIRGLNALHGWPKSKIAPAFCLGGGSVYYGGNGNLFDVLTSVTNDRARFLQADLLTNGGAWHWDTTHQASYISGTASANIGSLGISAGQRFFAPTPDSTHAYYIARWLIDNGFGGVAPYSVQFDVDPLRSFDRRLPSHRGLIAAKISGAPPSPPAPPAVTPPTATTIAATILGQTTAVFNGTVNSGGTTTMIRFLWGTSSNAYTDSALADQSPVASGSASVTKTVGGLRSGTEYYYRVHAYNSAGTANANEDSCFISAPPTNAPDITMLGSPIAAVTNPTGRGNRSIAVIQDGVTPPPGSTDSSLQYDTYTGNRFRLTDWIGYSFPGSQTFSGLIFEEGIHFSDGGWFTSLNVQVRVQGVWTNVKNLSITPAYAGRTGQNFGTYALAFETIGGDAIRIVGPPGGIARFISVAELRVLPGQSEGVPPDDAIPQEYALKQNYPNPFNPGTTVEFSLPTDTKVVLRVFNLLGQEVATLVDGVLKAGRHQAVFNASGPPELASGVYFYTLQAGKFLLTRKMLLVR